jgi:hypothetical protein
MDCEIDKNVLTATLMDGSYRKFRATLPKKFGIRGFGKLNVVDTLTPRINSFDYTYTLYDTRITMKFSILAKTNCNCNACICITPEKSGIFKLEMEEVFDPIDIDEIEPEMQPYFLRLQNQITYLENKLQSMTKQEDYYDSS